MEATAKRRFGTATHLIVAFRPSLAQLGMTDDRHRCSGIDQHRRGNRACVLALVSEVDVLRPDRKAGNRADRPLDQRRRQAQSDIDLWIARRSRRDRLDFGDIRADPMHLPIADNQLSSSHYAALVLSRP